jgi:alanine racemase
MASGNLVINLAAVRDNYRSIVRRVGAAVEVGGVVKADAYGTGAIRVSQALLAEGCRTFFTATAAEAVIVRGAVGPAPTVVVLGGYDRHSAAAYLDSALVPALASLAQLRSFGELAASAAGALRPRCFLQFDTGMNRLGLGPAETDEFFADAAQLLRHVELACVMTHPHSADAPDAAHNEAQRARFDALVARVAASVAIAPPVRASFANSFSTFRGAAYHYDLVRPGMALYGLNPLGFAAGAAPPMRRVVSLAVPVIQVRHAAAGGVVGYSATHELTRASVLATVSVGYADGFLRAMSNKGARLFWRAPGSGAVHALPLTGVVSMDMVIVDLTDVPADDRPADGDLLEALGDEQDADALGAAAGTIGYEILTSLGHRYVRSYVDDAE